MASGPSIRAARDGDACALIELIDACFAEYPGCILDVELEEGELRAVATAYAERAGRFWVAELDGQVVGCVGCLPVREGAGIELRKLYVARSARRRGLGRHLCGLVEAEARARKARFIEMWSDTRFTAAHGLYEKLGYLRGPQSRELHDLSHSVEHYFRKTLL